MLALEQHTADRVVVLGDQPLITALDRTLQKRFVVLLRAGQVAGALLTPCEQRQRRVRCAIKPVWS